MRRFFAIASVAALLAAGPVIGPAANASSPHRDSGQPVATASHRCSSGYTHAITPGGPKCLHAGQFCSHAPGYAKAYREAGYRCKPNGRLVRR
jgi:hypothetical protein